MIVRGKLGYDSFNIDFTYMNLKCSTGNLSGIMYKILNLEYNYMC